jgi:sortase A
MRLKNLILIFAALATVVVLAACGPSEQSGGDGGSNAQNQGQQEPPDEQVAPQQGTQEDSDDAQAAVKPPSDDMMKLTVPKMEQIEDDEIPTGLGTDETLFHDYAGVHIEHTGFPWEEEANVYIAGHRLGYEQPPGFLGPQQARERRQLLHHRLRGQAVPLRGLQEVRHHAR